MLTYYRNNKHTKHGGKDRYYVYMITSLACAYKTQLLRSLDGYSLMSELHTDPNDCLGDITVGTSAAYKELCSEMPAKQRKPTHE